MRLGQLPASAGPVGTKMEAGATQKVGSVRSDASPPAGPPQRARPRHRAPRGPGLRRARRRAALPARRHRDRREPRHPARSAASPIAGIVLTAVFGIFNFLAYSTTGAVARQLGAGNRRAAAEHGIDGALARGRARRRADRRRDPARAADRRRDGRVRTVRPFALTYLRISLLGAPFMLVALAGAGYLRGMQDTDDHLVIAVVANTIEPRARAAARVRPRPAASRARRGAPSSRKSRRAVAFLVDRPAIVRGARRRRSRPGRGHQATAVVGSHLVVRTGSLLLALPPDDRNRRRASRDVAVAAHQIAFQIWTFLALALDAIAIAGQAIVGRYLGADDEHGARRVPRRMLEWGVIAGFALGILAACCAPAWSRSSPTSHAVRGPGRGRCCGSSPPSSRSPPSCSSSTASSSVRATPRYLAAAMARRHGRLPARGRVRRGRRRRPADVVGRLLTLGGSPAGRHGRPVRHRPVARHRRGPGRLTRQSAEGVVERGLRLAIGPTTRFPLTVPELPPDGDVQFLPTAERGVSEAERMAARPTDELEPLDAIDALGRRRAGPDRARALAGSRTAARAPRPRTRGPADPDGRRRRVGPQRAPAGDPRRIYDPIYRYWFRVEWEGFEHIPREGGALLIANHAGAIPSDAPVIMHGIETELGRPVYGLAEYLFRASAGVRARCGPGSAAYPRTLTTRTGCCTTNSNSRSCSPKAPRAPASCSTTATSCGASGAAGSSRSRCAPGVPVIPLAVVGAEESMPIVFKSRRLAEAVEPPVLPGHREHARRSARPGWSCTSRRSSRSVCSARFTSTFHPTRSGTRAAGSWKSPSGSAAWCRTRSTTCCASGAASGSGSACASSSPG